MKPYYDDGQCVIYHADCREVMADLPDNSIDLIVADPPYFKVKGEAWDRQWAKPAEFLAWIGLLCADWQGVLKPNGSLYCFASPQMAAQVEVTIAACLLPLNRIRWMKEAGWHRKAVPAALRSYLSPWEEIVFAEHYGSDNAAKGEAGWEAKCDELRGFVFEPLRSYLDDERRRAGIDKAACSAALGFRPRADGMVKHYFNTSQWALPTEEHYLAMRALFGPGYLRREYEDLRRPFQVTPSVPYTDVWDFPTVSHYPGKHPCEKPLAMIEHIVQASKPAPSLGS